MLYAGTDGVEGRARYAGAEAAVSLGPPHSPARRAAPLDATVARVCIVMPVRNEAGHIGGALRSVLSQTFDATRTEIIVVDGESDDDTRTIAAATLPGVTHARILNNPRRTTTTGLNLGVQSTDADVIIRVDGHCRLEADYVQRCVDLLSNTGAANVGGLMRPRGEGLVGDAMALALCSKFGIGDSRFHYLENQEYVESVYLGAFRRDVLWEVGLFDETLLANEDFELNHRIREAGYGVLLAPNIRSSYSPRNTLGSIAHQFFRYGQWKARVMKKHPSSIQPRHLVAPALVASLALTLPGYAVRRKRWLLTPILTYALTTMGAAAITGRFTRVRAALCLVFPAMHLSWGLGILVGLSESMGESRENPYVD